MLYRSPAPLYCFVLLSFSVSTVPQFWLPFFWHMVVTRRIIRVLTSFCSNVFLTYGHNSLHGSLFPWSNIGGVRRWRNWNLVADFHLRLFKFPPNQKNQKLYENDRLSETWSLSFLFVVIVTHFFLFKKNKKCQSLLLLQNDYERHDDGLVCWLGLFSLYWLARWPAWCLD